MHWIFESNKTEAILIANAGNALNWKALLYKIEYVCPLNEMFHYNCYAISARLFIIGRKEFKIVWRSNTRKPSTDGGVCLKFIQSVKRSVKHVAFVDDVTGPGKLEEIKIWWDALRTEGQKYVYSLKPSKSFLFVEQHYKEYAERIFTGSNIKITT